MTDCKHGTIKGLCSVCDRSPAANAELVELKELLDWEKENPKYYSSDNVRKKKELYKAIALSAVAALKEAE